MYGTTYNRERGDLIQILTNERHTVLEHNLPYGVLQQRRKMYIQRGIPKEKLKITYPHY
jgi:hypothetical protein